MGLHNKAPEFLIKDGQRITVYSSIIPQLFRDIVNVTYISKILFSKLL